MELIGMQLREPEPATTDVTFWLSAPQPVDVTIPLGTEVGTVRTETEQSTVFSTTESFTIHVPSLVAVLASRPPQRSGEARSFQPQNLKRVQTGFEGFPAFADPPQVGDAMYFGFGEDMSRHIVGIDFDLDIAAGAGVDPTQPPYVWEVLSNVDPVEWATAELDVDNTRALNQPGVLSLHLPRMVQGRISDQTAYWLRVRLTDPPASVPRYRRSPLIKRVNAASWGCTMYASHAERIIGEVIGRSDGTPGQRFSLAHTPILPRAKGETLMVRISNDEEELWEEVPDFGSSSPNDRHFALDSSSGELRFGPALSQRDGSVKRYGAIPNQNRMLVFTRYRYGGGLNGNVKARTLSVLKTSIPYIARVANRKEARGGLDAENMEDAKLRVPAHLRTLQRAVTAADYEYLSLRAAPGQVQRVHALQPPTVATGEVKVLIIPRVNEPEGYIPPEALAIPDEVRNSIRAYLDERRLLSTRLDVLQPAYFWVTVRVAIGLSRFADPDAVKQRVEARLYEFLNPITGGPDKKGWPFGRSLYPADVINALLEVKGIDVVHEVKLLPISFDGQGKAVASEATDEVKLVAHGVIASYRHIVELAD